MTDTSAKLAECSAVTQAIAQALDETNAIALDQIQRAVECLGEVESQALLQEALDIETKGGMLTSNEERRRTPGGVFLYLVRTRTTPKQRRYIWPKLKKKKTSENPIFDWNDRIALVNQATESLGEANTVKITLIGRPGRVVEKNNVVLTVMMGSKAPPLPRGLPTPPTESTRYVVYIARKQWRRVATALDADADDQLIVEGYPMFDERLKTVAVFAIHTTTKALQAARRTAQALPSEPPDDE